MKLGRRLLMIRVTRTSPKFLLGVGGWKRAGFSSEDSVDVRQQLQGGHASSEHHDAEPPAPFRFRAAAFPAQDVGHLGEPPAFRK